MEGGLLELGGTPPNTLFDLSAIPEGVVDDVEPRADTVKDCPQDGLVDAPRDRDCESGPKAEAGRY